MIEKIEIIKGDIVDLDLDAIVNAANNTLLGGGGVDGAIHRAAGPKLLEECKKIGGCPTGEARISGAGNLKADYVIHTVGPIYKDGRENEDVFLRNAYFNSIKLGDKYGLKTMAFPFISAGVYGYPKEEAAKIALTSLVSALESTDLEKVYMVCHSQEDYELFKRSYSLLK